MSGVLATRAQHSRKRGDLARAENLVRGILVTTGWFGASSHAFATRSGRIDLVDGRAVKALLREHLGIEALLVRMPPRT
ncbi:restriction endonuclease [Streptomyces mirabilis]|uniref:restriction endonuclease n=1 Tax=Streptomyces mirabilis TaxID=68239 RepID=UPI0036B28617